MTNYRYIRHIQLAGIGEEGQQKIAASSVLIIGAGGLGCPVLQNLVAAGVGRIGIVDDDVVDISNLHRQHIYNESDVGKLKVDAVCAHLSAMNSQVLLVKHAYRLNSENIMPLLVLYDVVIDATDNFATKYLLSDACKLLKKVLVMGAVIKWQGQLVVFDFRNELVTADYRDIFPQPPSGIETCNTAGVVGAICQIIGSMQAAEVLKIICGLPHIAINKLVMYDLLKYELQTYDIVVGACALPRPQTLEQLISSHPPLTPIVCIANEITPSAFFIMNQQSGYVYIDVREAAEQPLIKQVKHINISVNEHGKLIQAIANHSSVVVFCNTGKRSAQAAQFLQHAQPNKTISHLKNGLLSLNDDERNKL